MRMRLAPFRPTAACNAPPATATAAVMAGTAQHGHARAGMRVSQPLPPPAKLERPQLSSGASMEDDDDDDTELVDDDGLELVPAPADNFHGRYFGAYRQSARNNRRDHFIAQIRWNGKRYCLGTYWTAVEAAKAYDWAARLIGGCRPRNFAADADLGEPPRTEAYQRLIAATLALRRPAAGHEGAEAACGSAERPFVGVSLHNSNKFRAHIRWRGEHYTLGYFPSAIAAAKAYDWAARQVGHDRRLNFAMDADLGEAPTGLAADRLAAAVRAARLKHLQPLRAGLKDAEGTFARRTLKRSAPDDNELSEGASAAKHGSAGKEAAAVQPKQPAAARPRIDRARLESKLVELLRLHELREDDLDLPALSECALRDIVIDLHWGRVTPPQPDAEVCLAGYSLLDLKARVRVNMRIREIDEAGAYLKALTGDDGREMLLDLLGVL